MPMVSKAYNLVYNGCLYVENKNYTLSTHIGTGRTIRKPQKMPKNAHKKVIFVIFDHV